MTRRQTESDLEARLHAVMSTAFPWLTADAWQHQTRFKIRLGHTVIDVGGNTRERLEGRADILVCTKGKPLAIIELKRAGLKLTEDDVAQALSYARLTTPMTPLVVVSNGAETLIHVTHTGEAWSPAEPTEQALNDRLRMAGQAATGDVQAAVRTLMGADSERWIPVLKELSRNLIASRSGDWGDTLAPFVNDFLLPRRATVLIAQAINQGKRAVVLHGPPLSGKSNVLRQLVEGTQGTENVAVLMLEAGEFGLFDAIAQRLSSELAWTVSSDEAREWLRRVSHEKKAALVLALDGLDPSMTQMLADVNVMSSTQFGQALRLVVTADDCAVEKLLKKPSGREHNAFGRVAQEIPLHPMGNIEFKHARAVLLKHRITVTRGGESVQSLREPWILRALVPADLQALPDEAPESVVRIPPLMDIDALYQAAAAFPVDSDLTMLLRETAEVILDSYLASRNNKAVLQGITTFAVERRKLEEALGPTGVAELQRRGLIKAGLDWAERATWFVRVPALLAVHLAAILAEHLTDWCSEPEESAVRLIALSSRLPFGDVIVADAIVRFATCGNGSKVLELLNALLQARPSTSSLSVGSRVSFTFSGMLLSATVTHEGKLAVQGDQAEKIEIDLEEGDLSDAITDLGGWLILSQIAGVPLGLDVPGAPGTAPLDEPLLLEVAQADVVLSGADGAYDFKEVVIHDIPDHGSMVCHLSGIVEPITWSLVKYLLHRGPGASAWIEQAVAVQSLPLLTRLHIALTHVSHITDARGIWAQTMLQEQIAPALAGFPMHH